MRNLYIICVTALIAVIYQSCTKLPPPALNTNRSSVSGIAGAITGTYSGNLIDSTVSYNNNGGQPTVTVTTTSVNVVLTAVTKDSIIVTGIGNGPIYMVYDRKASSKGLFVFDSNYSLPGGMYYYTNNGTLKILLGYQLGLATYISYSFECDI